MKPSSELAIAAEWERRAIKAGESYAAEKASAGTDLERLMGLINRYMPGDDHTAAVGALNRYLRAYSTRHYDSGLADGLAMAVNGECEA